MALNILTYLHFCGKWKLQIMKKTNKIKRPQNKTEAINQIQKFYINQLSEEEQNRHNAFRAFSLDASDLAVLEGIEKSQEKEENILKEKDIRNIIKKAKIQEAETKEKTKNWSNSIDQLEL